MEENINNNVQENNETIETSLQEPVVEQKSNKNNPISLIAIAIALSIIAIAASVFSLINRPAGEDTAKTPKVIQKGDLKIAYVNTDTILAKYNMALDMKKDLEAKQKQAENTFKSAESKLQSDYQNYMKTGDKLTLTQQKEKEKELQERMQKLQQMQTNLPMQLQEEQVKMNKKLLDAVYAFIADYNKKHDKYNVILSNSYMSSPTLYIDKGMDITDEILKGLNEEYKNYKEDK
ncbi:MAG: OmpH family outer membrane protein [Bacteroidales bacterium]|nr:OmpH family outer membrane protein [Candidatus Scybalousia scybalohippi]